MGFDGEEGWVLEKAFGVWNSESEVERRLYEVKRVWKVSKVNVQPECAALKSTSW